ncbi:MAG: hypothetical protein ABL962_10965 [Fimbriimonadaceae bacterium]
MSICHELMAGMNLGQIGSNQDFLCDQAKFPSHLLGAKPDHIRGLLQTQAGMYGESVGKVHLGIPNEES